MGETVTFRMLGGCRLPGRRGPSQASEWVLQADLGLENPVFSAVGGVEGQAGLGRPVLARAQVRTAASRRGSGSAGQSGTPVMDEACVWKNTMALQF